MFVWNILSPNDDPVLRTREAIVIFDQARQCRQRAGGWPGPLPASSRWCWPIPSLIASAFSRSETQAAQHLCGLQDEFLIPTATICAREQRRPAILLPQFGSVRRYSHGRTESRRVPLGGTRQPDPCGSLMIGARGRMSQGPTMRAGEASEKTDGSSFRLFLSP